jgi:hypothetical protein
MGDIVALFRLMKIDFFSAFFSVDSLFFGIVLITILIGVTSALTYGVIRVS